MVPTVKLMKLNKLLENQVADCGELGEGAMKPSPEHGHSYDQGIKEVQKRACTLGNHGYSLSSCH